MSQFKRFDRETEEKNTNKSTSGGKFMGLGRHIAKIVSVSGGETRNGDPFVNIEYVSEKDQKFSERLYPLYDGKASFAFINFAKALLPENGDLCQSFFTNAKATLATNPEKWEGLVGTFIGLDIHKGKKGYTIERDGEVLRLYDVEAGEFYNLAGGIPNEFEEYSEANEVAKSQELKRAWNRIKGFFASPNDVKFNEETITALSKDTGSL